MSEGILIDVFEDYVDEVILERGANYAKNQAVSIKKRTQSYLLAECRGTDNYEVKLRMDQRKILTYECTCPFEYGPICKHIAAVLYIIRDGMDLEEQAVLAGSDKKRITQRRQTEKILEELTISDMRQLLRKWTKSYMKLEKELIEFYRDKLLNKK